MTTPLIHISDEGPLQWIQINRPSKANAINADMLGTLDNALNELAKRSDLRCVILTGTGDKVFCAGADLTEPDTMAADEHWQQLFEKLQRLPALTIAMINGACYGGGLLLSLGCDMRIAAHNASFGYPLLRNNLPANPRQIKVLNSCIGQGRTRLLLAGDQKISASEAYQWGLIDRLYPMTKLRHECNEITRTALASSQSNLCRLLDTLRGH